MVLFNHPTILEYFASIVLLSFPAQIKSRSGIGVFPTQSIQLPSHHAITERFAIISLPLPAQINDKDPVIYP